MAPKKRGLEGAGEGGAAAAGGPPSPVFKKRCRSFDLEIRGCRHLQEFTATCVRRLEAAIESAVARIPEEVTKALTSFFSHAPSSCRMLVNPNQPPTYKLSFVNGLESEVFTKKTIRATDGKPLKICIKANNQQGTVPDPLLSAKIKVVVLDGDFNRHNQEFWSSEEFKGNIVLARDKVGAVLTGVSELICLKNGEAYLHGATFADNSKFVRSGTFRLGVMVDDNIGERVLEGITEPFVVKDRRGEGCKKHDIPLLDDAVWRLNKISEKGVSGKALSGCGIISVKHFLRLYYKDEQALRKILANVKESDWTTTVEHAKKCDPGKELYSFFDGGNNVRLFFNSVCQIIGVTFGDSYTPFNNLDEPMKDLVGQWSKDAYKSMNFDQPDYEMDNGKPRPKNQVVSQGLSMFKHKFTGLMEGHIGGEKSYTCQTGDKLGTSVSNSNQCPLRRLGSVRVTQKSQNDDDASYDFSIFLESSPDQYCASTSANDFTGSVTFNCPTTMTSEITRSVVLPQASWAVDNDIYDMPLTDDDVSVPQLGEEQQPGQAHFGVPLCAITALSECPLYSRHCSFKDRDCHEGE